MLSDCRSLVANLKTEVPSRVQDKRLQIELDRRHTPISFRWRRQAYGTGLPNRRRPCRLGSYSDTNSRLPHKEHQANIHAQSFGHLQVPDLARRVFQTQRWRCHCTYRAGRTRVGPDRVCSRRIGNCRSNERQNN